jgi:dTDP-4-dehydrorhamnose reductase
MKEGVSRLSTFQLDILGGSTMPDEGSWAIIGGFGQLGRALQRELALRAIDHNAISSQEIDIRDFRATRKFLVRLNPRVLINCAGWTDVLSAEANEQSAIILNAGAVENLALISKDIDAIFLHISSDYVFSGKKNAPYLVDDVLDPINAYGRSKALGESLLINLSLRKFYIFRTAWLYSEFGHNFMKSILKKRLEGHSPIKIVNDQFGSPTSASDLAFQIVETIIQNLPAGIYHAVNSGSASWYELATAAYHKLGISTGELVSVSGKEYQSGIERPRNSTLDTSGWEMYPIPRMQPWQNALASTIRDISESVERENSDGV